MECTEKRGRLPPSECHPDHCLHLYSTLWCYLLDLLLAGDADPPEEGGGRRRNVAADRAEGVLRHYYHEGFQTSRDAERERQRHGERATDMHAHTRTDR